MLIEIAGIDGSGKSTLQQLVRRHFLDRGTPAWERSLRSVSKLVFADLAAAEGHAHWSATFSVEEVEMAHAVEMVAAVRSQLLPLDLRRQRIITDTYVSRWLSTAAMWRAGNLSSLLRVFSTLPPPALSIRLDVAPDVAHDRLLARPQGDSLLKLSDVSKLVRYAEAFHETAGLMPYPVHVIDGGEPIEEVTARALELVEAAAVNHQTAP